MERGIYDYYNEVSCHISLNMVGSPHHSSDVYKHAAHNHVHADTFFHKLSLDNKEPLSSSSHTGKTLAEQSCKSRRRYRGGTVQGICEGRIPASSHKWIHTWVPLHHNPPQHIPSFHKDKFSSPEEDSHHTSRHGSLAHTHVSRTQASDHMDSRTGTSARSTPAPPLPSHTNTGATPSPGKADSRPRGKFQCNGGTHIPELSNTGHHRRIS